LAGRFLRAFEPLIKIMPEVRSPRRKVNFNERVFWTALGLIIYFVMSEVPLYGVGRIGGDSLIYYRVIFASRRGTIMELGIGPIVTAGLILQMLAGSKLIEVDFSNPDDRALFTGASKVLSMIMTAFEASAYIVSGIFGRLSFAQSIIIFTQLLIAGLIIILLDEMIQKGWGIGSGISLFILGGVAQKIMINCFSVIPVGGVTEPVRAYGIVPALIQAAISGGDFSHLTRHIRLSPIRQHIHVVTVLMEQIWRELMGSIHKLLGKLYIREWKVDPRRRISILCCFAHTWLHRRN